MTQVTHLFFDFENVKPSAKDIELVRGAHIRLWVLRGPHQNKFDADLAQAWQPLGDQVRFVQSTKSGKNALDFHIAFCLGDARQMDLGHAREGCYIIVSKDKGFDALFGYVRGLGSLIGRATSIPEALKLAMSMSPLSSAKLPAQVKQRKPAPAKTRSLPKPTLASRDADRVLALLRDKPRTRPTTRKKLEHYVTSILGNKVDPTLVATLIEELANQHVLIFEGTKVRYEFPKVGR
jgi:PIN domain